MRRIKRAAICLAVMMMAGVWPIMAAGATPEGEAIANGDELKAAYQNGGTYYLTAEIDLAGETLGTTEGKTLTLDYNGHRVTCYSFKPSVGESHTVWRDSSPAGNGGLTTSSFNNGNTNGAWVLTIESGVYESQGSFIFMGGDVTIKGGTMQNPISVGKKMTITGGTFNGVSSSAMNGCVLSLSGGTFHRQSAYAEAIEMMVPEAGHEGTQLFDCCAEGYTFSDLRTAEKDVMGLWATTVADTVSVVPKTKAAAPKASVTPGVYRQAQSVTLSTDLPNANIELSTGDGPLAPYDGSPINIARTTTIRARVTHPGLYDGEETSFVYTIREPITGHEDEAKIEKLTDGQAVAAGSPLVFEAAASGLLDGQTEMEGDSRLVPVRWRLARGAETALEGGWTQAPYTVEADTAGLSAGAYTLTVEYELSVYEQHAWKAEKTLEKTMALTITPAAAPTAEQTAPPAPTAPADNVQTGDSATAALWVSLLAAALLGLVWTGKKRVSR